MHRVRFNSSDSLTSFPVVQYDSPSALDEIRERFAASHGREPVDFILETGLAQQLEAWCRRRPCTMKRPSAVSGRPASSEGDPRWSAYVARFAIHFVKGIFVGAGMYTTDMILATTRPNPLLIQ